MKLLLATIAFALAFLCIQVDATHINCYINIFRGSLGGYEHVWLKNGNNIAGECFGTYFDVIAHQGFKCTFQSQKITKHPQYDQAKMELVTICPDDGITSTKVGQDLQSRGFNRF
ncbi:hypothetical protein [Absidia glauca]|uniref:Uncharacterized protein n=1 Tax=Absidia glauca TaxID=4829 RepID=A0A168QM37_ABSGL|nr:hypothetical protein [Absidia glauca]